MISGAHAILYSRNPDADRAFLRDVLRLANVDVGGGWLIFGLPPAEIAVHPSDANDVHELYLIADDIAAFVAAMKKVGVECSEIHNRGWGLLVEMSLPGGGRIGVYEPRHARPPAPRARAKRPAAAGKATAKPAKTVRKASGAKKKAAPKKAGSKATRKQAAKTARRRAR